MAIRRVYDRETGQWMEGEWLDGRELVSLYPERYSYTQPEIAPAKPAEIIPAPVKTGPAEIKRKGNPASLVAARAAAAAKRAAKANGAAAPESH